MLITILVFDRPEGIELYAIPEANIGADTLAVLKLAAGHYVSAHISNRPDVAVALNTILELVASDWGKYRIADNYFEDHDDGIMRVVVLGYLNN